MIPKPTKKKLTQYQKAKLGLIQQTIPAEKKKALERDNHQCIACGENSRYALTFHHVLWHSSERIHDETRNLYWRGVILCMNCHTTIPVDRDLDHKCRMHLLAHHPDKYIEGIPLRMDTMRANHIRPQKETMCTTCNE